MNYHLGDATGERNKGKNVRTVINPHVYSINKVKTIPTFQSYTNKTIFYTFQISADFFSA